MKYSAILSARSRRKNSVRCIYYPEEKLQLIKATGNRPGRLVPDHPQPAGEGLPERIIQIHPFEGSQIIAGRVLLYHPGVTSRIDHRAQQACLYQCDYQYHYLHSSRADDFIIAMCNLIQRLTIDSLHIVGDIYDRGPGAHIIMDTFVRLPQFRYPMGKSRYPLDGCTHRVMKLVWPT